MSKDWEKELMEGLEAYSDEVTKEVKEAADQVGKETAELLKKTSPRRTRGKKRGKYARGWHDTRSTDKPTETVVTVHNATDYQLTHLLENGHASRDGGFVKGIPHIGAAQEQASKNFEKKVEDILKG